MSGDIVIPEQYVPALKFILAQINDFDDLGDLFSDDSSTWDEEDVENYVVFREWAIQQGLLVG